MSYTRLSGRGSERCSMYNRKMFWGNYAVIQSAAVGWGRSSSALCACKVVRSLIMSNRCYYKRSAPPAFLQPCQNSLPNNHILHPTSLSVRSSRFRDAESYTFEEDTVPGKSAIATSKRRSSHEPGILNFPSCHIKSELGA